MYSSFFNLSMNVFLHIYSLSVSDTTEVSSSSDVQKEISKSRESDQISVSANTFTFRELASATKNFRADCLLGEGGFGRVYKGWLEKANKVCRSLISY